MDTGHFERKGAAVRIDIVRERGHNNMTLTPKHNYLWYGDMLTTLDMSTSLKTHPEYVMSWV